MDRTYGARNVSDIKKITIHHAAGAATAKAIVNHLRGSSYSANYVIGTEGDIEQDLNDLYAPITSSSRWNDMQAITIEVANSYDHTDQWEVTKEAQHALIDLCAALCGTYNIKPSYTGDSAGTFTTHDMFAATICPGPFLKAFIPELVDILNSESYEPYEIRYQSVDELPDWAASTIERLVELNIIKGNNYGLDLSEDMLRTIIIVDRMVTHAINNNK